MWPKGHGPKKKQKNILGKIRLGEKAKKGHATQIFMFDMNWMEPDEGRWVCGGGW